MKAPETMIINTIFFKIGHLFDKKLQKVKKKKIAYAVVLFKFKIYPVFQHTAVTGIYEA